MPISSKYIKNFKNCGNQEEDTTIKEPSQREECQKKNKNDEKRECQSSS